METVRDAESMCCPSAIPTKRDILLINRDSSVDDTFLRFERSPCPAYSICRGSNDNDREQQVMIFRDLLQSIKETALRLRQLITNITNGQQRSSESLTRYHVLQQSVKRNQQSNPDSGLIITTTSSSVCALCGIELHLEHPLKESRQFAFDKEKIIDDHNRDRDITSKNFDDVFLRVIPHETAFSVKKKKNRGRVLIHENNSGYLLLKKHNNYNIENTEKEEKVIQKIQPVNTKNDLRSKLLFTQQYSSTETFQQRLQTFAQMICPCTCQSFMTNRTEKEVSVGRKTGDNIQKVEETKMQKLKNDESIARYSTWDEAGNRLKEEITQQQLQTQVEELHRNIRQLRQENEYLRYLIERYRCQSERIEISLQLLIRTTYQGFTTAIEFLRDTYRNRSEVILTLTNTFQQSIDIQQIVNRMLAPFVER